jgi:hypothetical protein
LIGLLSFLGLQRFVERCFWYAPSINVRPKRAAIAIRDHVIPFQKWGTRQFTWPYLRKYYDKAWYFTQSKKTNHASAFRKRLEEALERYEAVDLFLLAHGNHYYQWVQQIPWHKRQRLRLVYNTGCKDLWQRRLWIHLGAKAYISHPGVSASPIFYVYFLRRWALGLRIPEAMAISNRSMETILHIARPILPTPYTPERVYRESKAFCYGQCDLHIDQIQPNRSSPTNGQHRLYPSPTTPFHPRRLR